MAVLAGKVATMSTVPQAFRPSRLHRVDLSSLAAFRACTKPRCSYSGAVATALRKWDRPLRAEVPRDSPAAAARAAGGSFSFKAGGAEGTVATGDHVNLACCPPPLTTSSPSTTATVNLLKVELPRIFFFVSPTCAAAATAPCVPLTAAAANSAGEPSAAARSPPSLCLLDRFDHASNAYRSRGAPPARADSIAAGVTRRFSSCCECSSSSLPRLAVEQSAAPRGTAATVSSCAYPFFHPAAYAGFTGMGAFQATLIPTNYIPPARNAIPRTCAAERVTASEAATYMFVACEPLVARVHDRHRIGAYRTDMWVSEACAFHHTSDCMDGQEGAYGRTDGHHHHTHCWQTYKELQYKSEVQKHRRPIHSLVYKSDGRIEQAPVCNMQPVVQNHQAGQGEAQYHVPPWGEELMHDCFQHAQLRVNVRNDSVTLPWAVSGGIRCSRTGRSLASDSSSAVDWHEPPGGVQVGIPNVPVPMLLRWRPKKSFKKKTMNLPSTKARRRWARLRR